MSQDKKGEYGEIMSIIVRESHDKTDERLKNILPIMCEYINKFTEKDIEFILEVCGTKINKDKLVINDRQKQELKVVTIDELLKSNNLDEECKSDLICAFKYFNCISNENIIGGILKYFKKYGEIKDIFLELGVPEEKYEPCMKEIGDNFKCTINGKVLLFSDYDKGKSYNVIVGPTELKITRRSYGELHIKYRIGDNNAGFLDASVIMDNGDSRFIGYGVNFDEKTWDGFSEATCIEIASNEHIKNMKEYIESIKLNNNDRVHQKFKEDCDNYMRFMQQLSEYNKNKR